MCKFLFSFLLSVLALSVSAHDLTIVTEDFPPYNYQENKQIKGVSSEVVLAMVGKANVEAEIKVLPWARAYQYATEKKNYLIYSIARISEREDLFHWIGPIAPYRTSLYKLKSREDISIGSLEEAKQYSIGCSIADVITTYLEGQGFTFLKPVARDTQNLHKLVQGRIDLVAYDEASFPFKVEQEGLDINQYERVFRIEDLSDELYMAFSKSSDPELIQKFQNALDSLKGEGIYEQIQASYFK